MAFNINMADESFYPGSIRICAESVLKCIKIFCVCIDSCFFDSFLFILTQGFQSLLELELSDSN